MTTTFDNMEGPSSSASSSSLISSRSEERPNTRRKQHRHERAANLHAHALRPRTNLRSPTPRDGSSSRTNTPTKTGGRLKAWQTEVLQRTFDAGVWNPRDFTVELLIDELGDRSGKQIRDWFSHRRRILRESGAVTRTENTENKSMALDGLIMLRLQDKNGNRQAEEWGQTL